NMSDLERTGGERRPDLLGSRSCESHGSLAHDKDELLSPDASRNITLHGMFGQKISEFPQDLVARFMAILIVDRLEAIKIEDDHRIPNLEPVGFEGVEQRPPVLQSCKGIRSRLDAMPSSQP